MKLLKGIGLFIALTCAVGCAAAVPPNDLVTARSSYERASKGPAGQANPADLHAARETLDVAEKLFKEDGDSQETRDMAYTATRRAEIAEVRSRTMMTTAEKNKTIAQTNAQQTSQVRLTGAALNNANWQLANQGQALATERQAREDADKRAAQAAADLAKFASVKQESRGMVITLSGAVLFASAKSDLLPSAQVKLNDVAEALTKQNPESKIVVEGHTDSQGAMAYNQDLSQRRAQTVRDYLVSRGLSADRVSAAGFGPTRSIADNASPEGRANNRRVEIVVTK